MTHKISKSSIFEGIKIETGRNKAAGAGHSANPNQADKTCQHPDCNRMAPHKAPVNSRPGVYHWYCARHIKEYNSSYNYFDGMSETAVQDQIRANNQWFRKTRPMAGRIGTLDPAEALRRQWTKAHRETVEKLSASTNRDKSAKARKFTSAPSAVVNAIRVMGITSDYADADEIKSRYRELVKKLHPDANGNLPHAADHLRRVIEAYALLRKHGYC